MNEVLARLIGTALCGRSRVVCVAIRTASGQSVEAMIRRARHYDEFGAAAGGKLGAARTAPNVALIGEFERTMGTLWRTRRAARLAQRCEVPVGAIA